MPTVEQHAFQDEPPTRPVQNISNRDVARRQALRMRLYRAVDAAIEHDEPTALATLDALVAATGGSQ